MPTSLPVTSKGGMKKHLSPSQKAIKKAQPHQSLSDIGFHQSANATKFADEVYARITAYQAEGVARVEAIIEEQIADQQIYEKMQQMVNSTQQTTTLLYKLKALTSTINTLEYRLNNNRGRGERGGNKGIRNDGGKDRRQSNSVKYCWSHGYGGHEGPTCRKNLMAIKKCYIPRKNGKQHQRM